METRKSPHSNKPLFLFGRKQFGLCDFNKITLTAIYSSHFSLHKIRMRPARPRAKRTPDRSVMVKINNLNRAVTPGFSFVQNLIYIY